MHSEAYCNIKKHIYDNFILAPNVIYDKFISSSIVCIFIFCCIFKFRLYRMCIIYI